MLFLNLIGEIQFQESLMHVDESKKFDKRNIERNIKNGVVTQKDYEVYLSRLTDASGKIFLAEEESNETDEFEASAEEGVQSRKKGLKKKMAKGK
jgi:hypothetical protein